MKLNDHFKKFIGNISLNVTRVNRIKNALSNWENKLSEDEEIKGLFLNFFSQGSYSTDTAIKPNNDGEFDVDAVLLIDIDEEREPEEVLKWIADRIKSNKEFKDKVKAKDRCVRINYAGDFHVDIVPAFPHDDAIKIPSKKEGEWVLTNPEGFTIWCIEINSATDGYFSKIVKIMKYWRDNNVGKDTAPKSILLTTLLGHAIVKKPSIAETLVETLSELINNLELLVEEDDINVENPSLEDENLARDWDLVKAKRFLNKVKKLKDKSEEAMNDQNKETSIEKWQEIFGTSVFPSEIGEAKDMAAKISSGLIQVSSTGVLNEQEGTKIRDHRFYGDSK